MQASYWTHTASRWILLCTVLWGMTAAAFNVTAHLYVKSLGAAYKANPPTYTEMVRLQSELDGCLREQSKQQAQIRRLEARLSFQAHQLKQADLAISKHGDIAKGLNRKVGGLKKPFKVYHAAYEAGLEGGDGGYDGFEYGTASE